jgi:hypothetical protein
MAAVVLLLQIWPARPASLRGWAVFVLLALPVIAAGEWLAHKLLQNAISRSVLRATQGVRFSWLRLAYLGFLALIVVLVSLLASLLWNR